MKYRRTCSAGIFCAITRLPQKSSCHWGNLRQADSPIATRFFRSVRYTRPIQNRGWAMTVYVDLVMGLNFLVDFLLILGTNRLAGFPPEYGRGALAAVLGSIYSGACLIPGLIFLANFFWRTVFLGLLGMTAFGLSYSGWKRTVIFLFLSMSMGGIALAMGRNEPWILILSGCFVWLLCQVGFSGRIGGREYVPVRISTKNVVTELTALRDTGNTLRDPISGEQVLLIGPEHACKLTGLSPDQLASPMGTMLTHPGFRLIPYRTVGQPGSMLLAKRFAKVCIGNWKGSALVAFAPETIGKGEVYQALTGGML